MHPTPSSHPLFWVCAAHPAWLRTPWLSWTTCRGRKRTWWGTPWVGGDRGRYLNATRSHTLCSVCARWHDRVQAGSPSPGARPLVGPRERDRRRLQHSATGTVSPTPRSQPFPNPSQLMTAPQIDRRMLSIIIRFVRADTPEKRAHVDLDTHYTVVSRGEGEGQGWGWGASSRGSHPSGWGWGPLAGTLG